MAMDTHTVQVGLSTLGDTILLHSSGWKQSTAPSIILLSLSVFLVNLFAIIITLGMHAQ